MDKDIQEMIKDKRIGSASIGAKVNDLTEEEDGSMKAIGIHGLEISLVAVPGDPGANIASAMQESFKLKTELFMSDSNFKDENESKEEEEEEKVGNALNLFFNQGDDEDEDEEDEEEDKEKDQKNRRRKIRKVQVQKKI